MIALLEIFGIYLGLPLVAVYTIWRLIGRRGFIGLDDTDSRLAKHFRKSKPALQSHKPAAYGA
jgi:hypothetical protein